MKCSQVRRLVSRYIDDDLSEGERRAFASHLQVCPGCRRELEESRAVHELLAYAERFSAPYGFTTRVMANLESKEQRVPSRFWRFLALRPFFLRTAEVAFALLVVAIGIVSGNRISAYRATLQRPAAVLESFSLDLFQATPPDSIGGIFATLMGANDER